MRKEFCHHTMSARSRQLRVPGNAGGQERYLKSSARPSPTTPCTIALCLSSVPWEMFVMHTTHVSSVHPRKCVECVAYCLLFATVRHADLGVRIITAVISQDTLGFHSDSLSHEKYEFVGLSLVHDQSTSAPSWRRTAKQQHGLLCNCQDSLATVRVRVFCRVT